MVDTTTFGSFNEDIDSLHGSLRPEVLLADAMQFEVCDLGRRKKTRHIRHRFQLFFF
jgi:hypothetical protein